MSMRAWIVGIAILFLAAALPTDIAAESNLAVQDFQTKASFDLVVQKSPVLKLGASRLETRSAFVTYTNEFFGGRTNALKIQFFTQPIGSGDSDQAAPARRPRHKQERLCGSCSVP